MADDKFIHDEWCDLDGTGKCDCYVSIIVARDERILDLQRAALDVLSDYEKSEGKYIDVTELQFMPCKEDRRAHLAAKAAKYRERILEGSDD